MNSLKLSGAIVPLGFVSVAIGAIAYAWSRFANKNERSWVAVAMETVEALGPIAFVALFMFIGVVTVLACYLYQCLNAEIGDAADDEQPLIPRSNEEWQRSIPADIATAELNKRGSDVLVVLHTPEGPVTFPAHKLLELADRRCSRESARLMYWINSNMPSPASTKALSN